jgi:hypothetical protein
MCKHLQKQLCDITTDTVSTEWTFLRKSRSPYLGRDRWLGPKGEGSKENSKHCHHIINRWASCTSLRIPLSTDCEEQRGYLTGTHKRQKLVVERLRYALNHGMKSKVMEKIQDRFATKLQEWSYIKYDFGRSIKLLSTVRGGYINRFHCICIIITHVMDIQLSVCI